MNTTLVNDTQYAKSMVLRRIVKINRELPYLPAIDAVKLETERDWLIRKVSSLEKVLSKNRQ